MLWSFPPLSLHAIRCLLGFLDGTMRQIFCLNNLCVRFVPSFLPSIPRSFRGTDWVSEWVSEWVGGSWRWGRKNGHRHSPSLYFLLLFCASFLHSSRGDHRKALPLLLLLLLLMMMMPSNLSLLAVTLLLLWFHEEEEEEEEARKDRREG